MPDPLNMLTFGTGTGAPVFLIHGFTGDAQRWVLIEDAVGAAHPMYAVEMPNHGASPKYPVANFDMLVARVAEAFDTLDADQVHIVGHSLGGAVAIALAAARPKQVATLSLLAPAGLGPKVAGDPLKVLATGTEADALRGALRCLVHDPALIDDDFVALAVEIRADPGLRAAQGAMAQSFFPDGKVQFDLAPTLNTLTLPTQIIWGKEDQIVPWNGALAAPGRVALHLFSDMGHIPQIEAPQEVAALLLSHFARCPR